MPNDPYKRVKTGDPIRLSARLHNDTIDTVVKVQRSGIGVKAADGFREGRGQTTVNVVNPTGANISRFSVVLLERPATTPFGVGNAGTGDLGTAGVADFLSEAMTWRAASLATNGQNYWHDDSSTWGIALDDIPANQTGAVCIRGIVPCIVHAEGPNCLQLDYVDVPMNYGTATAPNIGGGSVTVPQLHAQGRGKVLYLCPTEIPSRAKHHWAIVQMGDIRAMRFNARLTEVASTIGIYSAEGTLQRNWRWRYGWERHINRVPESGGGGGGGEGSGALPTANPEWGYQWRPPTESGLSAVLTHTTATAGDSGVSDTHYGLNRYESHLADQYSNTEDGTEGFFKEEVCQVPGGILENCPPGQAIVPMIRPIPIGAIVEMRGERDGKGRTIWSFEAMSPIDFERMNVPSGVYD